MKADAGETATIVFANGEAPLADGQYSYSPAVTRSRTEPAGTTPGPNERCQNDSGSKEQEAAFNVLALHDAYS